MKYVFYFVINLVYTTVQVRHMDEICLLLCDNFSLYYITGETHVCNMSFTL